MIYQEISAPSGSWVTHTITSVWAPPSSLPLAPLHLRRRSVILIAGERHVDKIGKWFGDNLSIVEMVAFTGLYQVPMVGSDVCGFRGDKMQTLHAGRATVSYGNLSPFGCALKQKFEKGETHF